MRKSFLRSFAPAATLALCSMASVVFAAGCSSAATSDGASQSTGNGSSSLTPDDAQELSLTPVQTLKDELTSALGDISASTQAAYLPKASALSWLETEVKSAGIADPTSAVFVLQVRKFPLEFDIPFDHSEVDIDAVSDGSKTAKIHGRLIGDVWGAGLYNDTLTGGELGPPLCVTWAELVQAINASYVDGFYLGTFVCHNITFRVLDTLGVSVSDYADNVRAWLLASYAYGPIFAKTVFRCRHQLDGRAHLQGRQAVRLTEAASRQRDGQMEKGPDDLDDRLALRPSERLLTKPTCQAAFIRGLDRNSTRIES